MPNYEEADRVLELTRVLEDLLECFDESPAGYAVQSEMDGLVNVGGDVEEAINRAREVLNGTDTEE